MSRVPLTTAHKQEAWQEGHTSVYDVSQQANLGLGDTSRHVNSLRFARPHQPIPKVLPLFPSFASADLFFFFFLLHLLPSLPFIIYVYLFLHLVALITRVRIHACICALTYIYTHTLIHTYTYVYLPLRGGSLRHIDVWGVNTGCGELQLRKVSSFFCYCVCCLWCSCWNVCMSG